MMDLTDSKKKVLDAILEKLPISADTTRVLPDAEIRGLSLESPFNSAVINRIKFLEDRRSAAFDLTVSLENGYRRTLGLLASGASSIEIMDPYAGTAICDSRIDRLWLLRQLCESGVSSIHVITCIPRNSPDRPFLRDREWRNLIERQLFLLSREYGISISCVCYSPDRNFHNRRLLFTYSYGAIGCLLEKGIDGFAKNPLEVGSAVKPLTEAEYHMARRGLETLTLAS
jgi:hypothetical protein